MDQPEEQEPDLSQPPPQEVKEKRPPPHRRHFNLIDGEIRYYIILFCFFTYEFFRFTFGMEQRKKNILHVIGSNMIAYTSGNYVTFHDLKHRQQMFQLFFLFS